jgi:hypothetical protein
MYRSITAAAVRDEQYARIDQARAERRARAAAAACIAAPAPAGERGHQHVAPHPLRSFYRWLAAGQL